MKKKSIVGRIGIVAVALTLATTSLMSGTLAKFITTREATATALVAKWNPTIGVKKGNTNLLDVNKEFSLLATATNTTDTTYLVNGDVTASSEVVKVLAPGVEGGFDIIVDMSKADVDSYYSVYIDGNATDFPSNPENLKVTYGTTVISGNQLKGSEPTLLASGFLASDATVKAAGLTGTAKQTATINVSWRWEYEDNASSHWTVQQTSDYEDSSKEASNAGSTYTVGNYNDKLDTDFITKDGLDLTKAGFKVRVLVRQAGNTSSDRWSSTT